MTRRVSECGWTPRPQQRPQGFYQSVHEAAAGLWPNLTHSEASFSNTSAACRHDLGSGLPAWGQITAHAGPEAKTCSLQGQNLGDSKFCFGFIHQHQRYIYLLFGLSLVVGFSPALKPCCFVSQVWFDSPLVVFTISDWFRLLSISLFLSPCGNKDFVFGFSTKTGGKLNKYRSIPQHCARMKFGFSFCQSLIFEENTGVKALSLIVFFFFFLSR